MMMMIIIICHYSQCFLAHTHIEIHTHIYIYGHFRKPDAWINLWNAPSSIPYGIFCVSHYVFHTIVTAFFFCSSCSFLSLLPSSFFFFCLLSSSFLLLPSFFLFSASFFLLRSSVFFLFVCLSQGPSFGGPRTGGTASHFDAFHTTFHTCFIP